MDTEKALVVLKHLIDTATAEGGFKSADQVIIAVTAWNTVKAAIEKKETPVLPASA